MKNVFTGDHRMATLVVLWSNDHTQVTTAQELARTVYRLRPDDPTIRSVYERRYDTLHPVAVTATRSGDRVTVEIRRADGTTLAAIVTVPR